MPAETEVAVHIVVQTTVSNEVLRVNGTAEPLKRVVVGVGRLNVVNDGVATNRTHGESIDFLVDLVSVTTKLNTHVLQHSAVVVVVGSSSAAVFRISSDRKTFNVANSCGCSGSSISGQVVGGFT